MAKSELTIVAEFVQKAKRAKDYIEAEKFVDEAMAKMKAAGIDESSAITILSTAVASAGNDPGLFHAHTALDRRKP